LYRGHPEPRTFWRCEGNPTACGSCGKPVAWGIITWNLNITIKKETPQSLEPLGVGTARTTANDFDEVMNLDIVRN